MLNWKVEEDEKSGVTEFIINWQLIQIVEEVKLCWILPSAGNVFFVPFADICKLCFLFLWQSICSSIWHINCQLQTIDTSRLYNEQRQWQITSQLHRSTWREHTGTPVKENVLQLVENYYKIFYNMETESRYFPCKQCVKAKQIICRIEDAI